MKNSMMFAVALFFALSSLCSAAPVVLPQDSSLPVRPDIGELVANSPFFMLPSGDYAPFETHIVKNDVKSKSDVTTSVARVAGSPVCRSTHDSITSSGNSSKWMLKWETLTWAGLFALNSHVSQINQFAPSTSTTQVTRLDKLIGQPFPLKAENTFSWEVTYDYEMTYHKTSDKPEKVTKSASVWQYSCQVGATSPASVVKPGLKGLATALACTVTQQGGLSKPLAPATYYWLDSVGCFVKP